VASGLGLGAGTGGNRGIGAGIGILGRLLCGRSTVMGRWASGVDKLDCQIGPPVLNVGLFAVFGLLEIEDRIDHTNSVLK
jgi:hypothetical protein